MLVDNGKHLTGSMKRTSSGMASSNQLLQFLSVHPRKPGNDPILERKRMSMQRISAVSGNEKRTMFVMRHSHCNPVRKPWFHWDLHTVFVQGIQDLEHGQHLGDGYPHRCVGNVSSGTDASTEPKCDVLGVVWFERTVIVEESLGYERVWVGVPSFVVRHRPCKRSSEPCPEECGKTDHRFATRRAP